MDDPQVVYEQKNNGLSSFSLRLLLPLFISLIALASFMVIEYSGVRQRPEPDPVRSITVFVGGESHILETKATTVGDALRADGLSVGPDDKVHPDPATELKDEMAITIIRAFPVILRVDGKEYIQVTTAVSVRDVLHHFGITVDADDKVVPEPDTVLIETALIVVTRVRYDVETKEEPVPYSIIRRDNAALEEGRIRVVQQGRVGVRRKVYRLVYEDGELVRRYVISDVINRQPRPEIREIGTKKVYSTLVTSRGMIRYERVVEMVATAYYPGPESTGEWADGYTATGVRAGHGVVAVDPEVIPLGTSVFIPGYGLAVAADVGGAIKGKRIDLCFDTYREAIQFGRQKVNVFILP